MSSIQSTTCVTADEAPATVMVCSVYGIRANVLVDAPMILTYARRGVVYLQGTLIPAALCLLDPFDVMVRAEGHPSAIMEAAMMCVKGQGGEKNERLAAE